MYLLVAPRPRRYPRGLKSSPTRDDAWAGILERPWISAVFFIGDVHLFLSMKCAYGDAVRKGCKTKVFVQY